VQDMVLLQISEGHQVVTVWANV